MTLPSQKEGIEMDRTKMLEEKGWEIWASDRDERIDSETFVAMNTNGSVSLLYFYENGDGVRCVDQYFESSLIDSIEDLEVLNQMPESFLKNFDVDHSVPDWYGPEDKWWKM